jgi:hypothetical protein
MSERYSLEDHENYRERVEAERRKAEADRRERADRDAALRSWLADGGRESDFDATWASMRDDMRRRRIRDADAAARAAQAGNVSRI